MTTITTQMKSETNLEVVKFAAVQQWASTYDAVGYSDHEQHGGVVAEQIIHETQPLIFGQHLREERLKQWPRIHLHIENTMSLGCYSTVSNLYNINNS